MVISSRSEQRLYASAFATEDHFLDWLFDFAHANHSRLDALKPFAGGYTLQGRFRWHAVLPPVSGNDIIFSLRKTRFSDIDLDAFADPNMFLPHVLQHVDTGGSLIVCGLPAAGKSTFLSALMKARCHNERIVILEEVAEFQISSPHWIQLVARGANTEGTGGVSLRQLFLEALRLRPERMVLAEIRDKDDIALAHQIMSGMQKGLLATFHAGDLDKAFQRFQDLSQTQHHATHKIAFCLMQFAVKPLIQDLRFMTSTS